MRRINFAPVATRAATPSVPGAQELTDSPVDKIHEGGAVRYMAPVCHHRMALAGGDGAAREAGWGHSAAVSKLD